jgi:hypothetical protein
MHDPTMRVESVAQSLSKLLLEDYEHMTDLRRQTFRAAAFQIYSQFLEARFTTLDDVLDILEEVRIAPSTPKSWLRGVEEATNAVAVTYAHERDFKEVGSRVPETLFDGWADADPLADIVAGDVSPHAYNPEAQCGHWHLNGWQCSRPEHPSHWKHYDHDPTFWDEDAEFMDEIIVTWYADNAVETYHPNIELAEDE